MIWTVCDDLYCCKNCRLLRRETIPLDGVCRWKGTFAETFSCRNKLLRHSLYPTEECIDANKVWITGKCYPFSDESGRSYFLNCQPDDDGLGAGNNITSIEYIYKQVYMLAIALVLLFGIICGYLAYKRQGCPTSGRKRYEEEELIFQQDADY